MSPDNHRIDDGRTGSLLCMLFSEPIDSLAGAGAILADVWLDNVSMPVVDSLGEEFLSYVKDDMTITVKDDGVVVVE